MFKQVIVALTLLFGSIQAFGQASLLPNAKQTFVGPTGAPLASGTVDLYVPNSNTRKNSWTNATESGLNTNPIALDAAGRAVIYGQGTYRQVVKDALGNTQWDAVTTAPSAGTSVFVTDVAPVGTILAYSGIALPTNYLFADGSAVSRTTYSQLFDGITQIQAATVVSGSAAISGLSTTTQVRVGSPIEGTCLPASTTVSAITGTTTLTASANSTTTGSCSIRFLPYGGGNGTTTFNVPNMSGRVPAGRDNLSGSTAGVLTSAFCTGAAGTLSLGSACGTQSQVLSTTHLAAHDHASPAVTDPGHTHFVVNTDTGAIASPTNSTYIKTSASDATNFAYSLSGSATQPTVAPVQTKTTGITLASTTGSTGSGAAFSIVQPVLVMNYIIKYQATNPSGSGGVISIGGLTGDILCGPGLTCDSGTNTISVSGTGGDVTGPSSATNQAVAIFNGTTGKIIENSGVTISGGALGDINTGKIYIKDGKPWADVVAWGATGCPSDNWIAIQSAVNALNALGGGVLYFPPGGYCVSTTINIAGSTIRVQGAGINATTLRTNLDVDVTPITLNFSWSSINNMTIAGKGAPGNSDTIFGATTSTVAIGSNCVSCQMDQYYVTGGVFAINVGAPDVRIHNGFSAYAYGQSNLFIGGTAVAGVRLEGISLDQNPPGAIPTPKTMTSSAWAALTPYTANTSFVTSDGYLLQAMSSGTSSGTKPTLKNYGENIPDGSGGTAFNWQIVGASTYYALQIDTGGSEVLVDKADISGASYTSSVAMTNTASGVGAFSLQMTNSVVSLGQASLFRGVVGADLYLANNKFISCLTTTCKIIDLNSGWTGNATITGGRVGGGVTGISVAGGVNTLITGVTFTDSETIDISVAAGVNQVTVTGNHLSGTSGLTIAAGGSDYISAQGNVFPSGTGLTDGSTGTHNCIAHNAGSTVANCANGGLVAGGSNTQVQYNNAGALGGISRATSDGTLMRFAVNGLALRDASAARDVFLNMSSGVALTNDRILTVDMANVAHTLALGTTPNTITFPNAASYTVAGLSVDETFTANQSFAANVYIKGGRPWTDVIAWCGEANAAANPTTGLPDSSTCIQNAINYMYSTYSSGDILVPPGFYCVNSGVTTAGKSNLRILGSGRGGASRLSSCQNDATVVTMAGSYIEMHNLALYGKGSNSDSGAFGATVSALLLSGCAGCQLHSVASYGGLHAMEINASSDVSIYDPVASYSFGSSNLYFVGVVNGARVFGGSVDQGWVGAQPTYPFTLAARQNTHAYVVDDVVSIVDPISSRTYLLQATVAGTSGGSAPTLKNYLINITDGGVTWKLVAPKTFAGVQVDGGAAEIAISKMDMSGAFEYPFHMTNTVGGGDPSYVEISQSTFSQGLAGGAFAEFGAHLVISDSHLLGCNAINCFLAGTGSTWTSDFNLHHNTIANGASGVLLSAGPIGTLIDGNLFSALASGITVQANAGDITASNNDFRATVTASIAVAAGTGDNINIIGNKVPNTCTITNAATGTHNNVVGNGSCTGIIAGTLTLTAPILGTPTSGTVTNLTGTASININGTVGATTPTTGKFTTTNIGAGSALAGTTALVSGNVTSVNGSITGTTYLQVVGADANAPVSSIMAFGSLPLQVFTRANGTAASPTVVAANDQLGVFGSYGWNGSSYHTAAYIEFVAIDTFSGSQAGASVDFFTTPSGSNTLTAMARFGPAGGLSVGSAGYSSDPGNGGILGTGTIKTTATTTSTSKTTGAIISGGGLGVAGAIFTDTLSVITMANTATTSAVCYNTGTGLITYDGTIGTCTVSDGRLKDIDGPLTSALDKLLKINGVYYHWKDIAYGSGRQIGVIAQDVEKVFPELVSTDSEGKKSADYQRLVAPIIEALRELKADNDNLRRRLSVIERRRVAR